MRFLRASLTAAFLIGCSCAPAAVTPTPIPGLGPARTLYGRSASFCATVREGLRCWHTTEEEVVRGATTLLAEGDVDGVAIVTSEICVLQRGTVTCSSYFGMETHVHDELEEPSAVVGFSGIAPHVCALDHRGVWCWEEPRNEAALVPGLGIPSSLSVSLDGEWLCGRFPDRVVCAEPLANHTFTPPVTVMGGDIDEIVFAAGDVTVLRGTQLAEAHFDTLRMVGSPFEHDDPLDVPFETLPHTEHTLVPEPTPGMNHVRSLALAGASLVFVDDTGLAETAFGGRIERDHGGADTVWSGSSTYFARDGDTLYERGRIPADHIDREIVGLHDVTDVAAGVWWTCILDGSGAVGCVPTTRAF